MSDAVTLAAIGVLGSAVGAVATLLVVRIRAAQKDAQPPPPEPQEDKFPVLGEAVDNRELRILRALFGEPQGRALKEFRKYAYYRPSLDAVVGKGWAEKIEGRYFLTVEGAAFCRAYLTQVLAAWQPGGGRNRQRAKGTRTGTQQGQPQVQGCTESSSAAIMASPWNT